MPVLSDWKNVDSADGSIPEALLPCACLQYRWVVSHMFTPPPGWGVSGGKITMEWELALDDLASIDTVRFMVVVFVDPLLPGVILSYAYWDEYLHTTGPETVETLGGDELTWVPETYLGGASETEVLIAGTLMSPVYELELAAGATVDVRKHFPCSGIGGVGWILQVRTAPGGETEMPVLTDHPTRDQHHFRLHRKVLLMRTWLSAFSSFDGPTYGLELSPGSGLSVAVSAGGGLIGHMPAALVPGATVDVAASTRNHIWAVIDEEATGQAVLPQLKIEATVGDEKPEGIAYLLGIVDASSDAVAASGIDTEHQGVVVCFDADQYGASPPGEDGSMRCVVDRGSSTDEIWESTDKGLRWDRVTE